MRAPDRHGAVFLSAGVKNRSTNSFSIEGSSTNIPDSNRTQISCKQVVREETSSVVSQEGNKVVRGDIKSGQSEKWERGDAIGGQPHGSTEVFTLA